ncbi:hypothetical protein H5410_030575 [Solanum commersonii]|uniref:Uncharacterized protein n=1 Tax=Solanum commersonii TaxID=4109 RepID=A0A9J5YGK0_SOLCO|nr:hypothetical protein H5410_030575 [Solanum commersonii]
MFFEAFFDDKTLITILKISSQEESLSSSRQMVNLEDIPKDTPLYGHMQAYLAAKKQNDTFSSITNDDTDNIKSYEKLQKKEMIFLLENYDLQRKGEPWKIFQRYLINGLYYPGELYRTQSYYEEILISSGSAKLQHFSGTSYNPHEKVYNFSKIIINVVISIEDWGIIDDNSVRHIARRICFQEGDKESMINNYLEEVKRNLLQTITQIDKSDTSMRSETSNDDITEESQQVKTDNILSANELKHVEEFMQQMKDMDKRHVKEKT